MKHVFFFFALALASGLCAAPIQPGQKMAFNDPDGVFALSPTYASFDWTGSGSADASRIAAQKLQLNTGSDTLSAPLAEGIDLSAIPAGQSLALDMAFTLPTDDPQISEFVEAGVRFGMAPKADGTLLFTDLNAQGLPTLTASAITVEEGVTYPVTILSTWAAGTGIRFTITIGDAPAVTVKSIIPENTDSEIAAVLFAGEATIDNLALAGTSAALPEWLTDAIADASGDQYAALETLYFTWLETVAGGEPDADGADADAFLFNLPVGSTPALTITALSVGEAALTVTVKATAAEADVDLAAINGALVIYAAEALPEPFAPYEVIRFTTDAQGAAIINIPLALGRFAKAAVLYLPPADSFDSGALN